MNFCAKHSNWYRGMQDGFDASSVEDNLLKPRDHQVLLSASVAFLQKRLQDKLEAKISDKSQHNRSYSNLLIFEISSGDYREKYYVRVKNTQKYDEIFERESRITPKSTLKLRQLLPKPKKPKSKDKRLRNLFGRSLTNFKFTNVTAKKSASLFTIFKRNPSPSRSDLGSTIASSIQLESDFLPVTESQSSVSGFVKPERSKTFISRNGDAKPQTVLGPEELEILRLIPSSQMANRLISDSSAIAMSNCSHGTLKQQSSKLSVCLEEADEESEHENMDEEDEAGYSSCNLTDEVKSNFSPEALDVMMRRLLHYFEYSPTVCKRNC